MARLEDYRPIAGTEVLEELSLLARPLSGKTILNVNSTAVGGGVAEILHRMVPLMKELGYGKEYRYPYSLKLLK